MADLGELTNRACFVAGEVDPRDLPGHQSTQGDHPTELVELRMRGSAVSTSVLLARSVGRRTCVRVR